MCGQLYVCKLGRLLRTRVVIALDAAAQAMIAENIDDRL
jgi:hypothetical protein